MIWASILGPSSSLGEAHNSKQPNQCRYGVSLITAISINIAKMPRNIAKCNKTLEMLKHC